MYTEEIEIIMNAFKEELDFSEFSEVRDLLEEEAKAIENSVSDMEEVDEELLLEKVDSVLPLLQSSIDEIEEDNYFFYQLCHGDWNQYYMVSLAI